MAFPKSRILSAKRLVQQLIEDNRQGSRFCFILGSGASAESGIPSGNALEMRWMNCLMGKARDNDTAPMNPEETRKLAQALFDEKELDNPFEKIEKDWAEAVNKNRSMSSDYYFDIYKLRFHPNPSNGFRYLQNEMADRQPSFGYHTLALLLTDERNNNLVITTNFDSLTEDALFLFTNKKPLVVGHEALAGYIDSDIHRPIITKIHRGLMYDPLNSTKDTGKLPEQWRKPLEYAFQTYTPIVIGYGGGDHSLMSFMEDSSIQMRHGIYWCFRKEDGLPSRRIQKLVQEKGGCLVEINGFDDLMLHFGSALYQEKILPGSTEAYLTKQAKGWAQTYSEQYEKLKKNPETRESIQPIQKAEEQAETQREKTDTLTALDYFRRGYQAQETGDHQAAIDAYGEALKLEPNLVAAYYNRGNAYNSLGEYEKAVADYTRAIELDPNDAFAHNNRGYTYDSLGKYEKAIADCTRAIELDPKLAEAYKNRASAYRKLGKTELAEADEKRAAELEAET